MFSYLSLIYRGILLFDGGSVTLAARAGSMHFGTLGKTLKWGLKNFFLSNFFFFKVTIFFLKKKKIKYVLPLLSQIMQSFQLEKS
jgi:uncharacterized membrane protein required for colicin V production